MLAKGLVILGLTLLGSAYGIEFARENSMYDLECSLEPNWNFQYWMVHEDGKIGGDAYQTGVHEHFEVFSNGTLRFKKVSITHEGTHLCVGEDRDRGRIRGFPVQMYVRPAPSQNLWEDKYKTQFLVGFISALVCAILLGGSCLVYRFRWKPEGEDTVPINDKGHENPAMDPEEPQTIDM